MYLILGSGSLGFALAKELKDRDKELFIVDKDPQKVETMREESYDAIVGDISDIEILDKINTKNIAAVMVLSSDSKANKTALSNIRNKVSHDAYCVSRASDTLDMQEMENLGANLVIIPPKVVAKSLARSLDRAESMQRGNKLVQWFNNLRGKTMGIIIHNNPDPDAISGALALQEIASTFDVQGDILYSGEIGHQENKAFVNLLDIELFKMEEADIIKYDKLALVDCSIPGFNNNLSSTIHIDAVFDHHPIGDAQIDAEFIDIRPHVGASATIMTKYLQELNIDVDKKLATALLYGIRTDTLDFKRNTDTSDLSAASFLYPLSDHSILDQLERPSMSTETLDVLGEAILNRQIYSGYLISNVGAIRDRDTLPQAADYLLNLEGVFTTLVFGVSDDTIYISGRSNDIRVNLGDVMKNSFGEGFGGGHATAAAAQVPLGVFSAAKDKQTLLKLVNESIVRRFLNSVGVEESSKK